MSDHIPDATKMIGDTPRTDEWTFDVVVKRGDAHIGREHYKDGSGDFVESDFARQLERELNAANERISKLNDYVAALETAGDLMANELSYGYDVDMWNKAKEAKP